MRRLGETLSWALPFAILVTAIVAVPLRIFESEGLPRFRALRDELADVQREGDRVRREVELLHRDVEALRTDPAAVERIARDELGMIRPGEIVFQFPP